MQHQFFPKYLRKRLFGQVIERRSQPTCCNNNICTRLCLLNDLFQAFRIVPNDGLIIYVNSQL